MFSFGDIWGFGNGRVMSPVIVSTFVSISYLFGRVWPAPCFKMQARNWEPKVYTQTLLSGCSLVLILLSLDPISFSPGLNSTLSLFTGLLLPLDAISFSPSLNSTLSLFHAWSLFASWHDHFFLTWFEFYLPFLQPCHHFSVDPCIAPPSLLHPHPFFALLVSLNCLGYRYQDVQLNLGRVLEGNVWA